MSNEPTSEPGGPGPFPWAPPQPGALLASTTGRAIPPTPTVPPDPAATGIDEVPGDTLDNGDHRGNPVTGVAGPVGPFTVPPMPAPAPPSAPPARRRRPLRWLLALVTMIVLVGSVAVTAGSWRYAEINRRDAEDNLDASRQWQQRAEAQQQVIDEQVVRLAGLETEIVTLKAQIAELERTGQGATARAEGLQALLDETTRRLTEAENRVAALAGEQARMVDDRILGR